VDITANQGDDASFDGFYVLGSYFLTGEHRPYKSGSFGKVKPNSADGAWEIVLRYSSLDGRDNGTGVLGKNTTFGANYYMSPSMRMMFNYISTDLESDTVLAEDTGSGISLRFQYIW
jgi:phosphate-selective porin OprO/OprP